MGLTVEGVKLLREVQRIIAAHPERLDMGKPCGTVCCIGGHVYALTGGAVRDDDDDPVDWHVDVQPHVRRELGMSLSDGRSFFSVADWPEDLRIRHDAARATGDAGGVAAATCERIDRFIAEHSEIK